MKSLAAANTYQTRRIQNVHRFRFIVDQEYFPVIVLFKKKREPLRQFSDAKKPDRRHAQHLNLDSAWLPQIL